MDSRLADVSTSSNAEHLAVAATDRRHRRVSVEPADRLAGLQRLQVGEQIIDLARRQHELRHLPRSGMADDHSFRQSFRERFDVVALMQCSEGRRGRVWARARSAYGVARGAMKLR